MRLTVRKLQILGCCATVAVATVAAACSHHSLPGRVADPHADPGISKARAAQILNAVGAVSAQVSQAELAARGRALFFSTSFGRPGESCGTCHIGGGGVNPRIGTIVHPIKAGDFTGPRDPIQLWGVARTAPYTWSGNVPTLEQQVTNVIITFSRDGKTQPAQTTAEQAAAILAYLKTLDPPVTDFDNGTMSDAAKRGEELFRGKAACVSCHGGPMFTDNNVHNTGVPKVSGKDTDPGNAAVPGAFNTTALRDVRNTAPYMHNGVLPTLEAVMDFYSGNKLAGVPQLSGPEKADIIAYLDAL